MTCGARKPGFDQRPMIGANSQPCVLDVGHGGDHRNVMGRTWPRIAVSVVTASAEDDGRGSELAALQADAAALWRRVLAGKDSPYLRTRIARLEALQAALIVGDATLIAKCHCGASRAVA